MVDTLRIVGDSLISSVDSSLIETLAQADSVDLKGTNLLSVIAASSFGLKILLPLFLLVIGWVLKLLFDKYIAIRPRLYLILGKPLYSQRLLGYDVGHELTWIYESTIKNNSKHDAYDIEIFEYKPDSVKHKVITNRQELDHVFIPNNHISSNQDLKFEIKKTINTSPETLIRFEKKGNETYVIPGLKISNPQKALRPNELNTIRLVVKYKNEKGKVFYTKFLRKDNEETNRIKSVKPWIINGLVK